MPRAAFLPRQLQYLQPFRKEFASRPSEELDEDSGFASLLALLKRRIKGHSTVEAEKVLEEDKAALQNWLSAPEQINDCLHFAAGVFLIMSPAELVKQILEDSVKEFEPLPWVEMDLPAGIKPRRFEKQHDGGMFVKWKGFTFAICAISDENLASAKGHAAHGNGYGHIISCSVQFGEAAGTKYVRIGENRFGRPDKDITYVLVVPGGHVQISLCKLGKRPSAKWDDAKWKEYAQLDRSKWDETPVESFFHTLRVEMKQMQNE